MPHLATMAVRLPSAYMASMAAWTAVFMPVSSLRIAMPMGAGLIGVPPTSYLPALPGRLL